MSRNSAPDPFLPKIVNETVSFIITEITQTAIPYYLKVLKNRNEAIYFTQNQDFFNIPLSFYLKLHIFATIFQFFY